MQDMRSERGNHTVGEAKSEWVINLVGFYAIWLETWQLTFPEYHQVFLQSQQIQVASVEEKI